jgi:hypothetical protein
MMRDHTVIEELLAIRALAGLDDDDAATLERELASHGDCEECLRLRDGFEETAGRLAFALEPQPVDPAIVDRILAEDRRGGDGIHAPGGLPARRAGRWRGMLAVAASFLVLVAGVAVIRANSGGVVVVAAQRFLTLEGSAGDLALAYTPGQRGIVVWGRGLPDPGTGNVYELWAITGGTPASRGCLRPSGGGLAAFIDGAVGDAEVMAVTVERESCPDAPTSDPVYVGEPA